jgi:4-amino-4-deoxychorismate lyase
MALEADFSLFSSLRYDPNLLQIPANASVSHKPDTPSPFYMLRFHRDRMLLAAKYFQWEKAVSRLTGDVGLEHLNQDLEGEVKNWFASSDVQESQSLKVCPANNKPRHAILYSHLPLNHRSVRSSRRPVP